MSHIRFSKAIVFAVLAVAMILPASAAARARFGVGVGFGYFGGPFYPYGYGPWGYPYYGYPAYGYGSYGYGRPVGQLHIKSPVPKAQIYINGAFAGNAHALKNIYLAPGTYNVEQRIGNDVQKERVYVLADRSLTIEFDPPGTHSGPAPNAAPAPRQDAVPQPPPDAPRPEANTAPQPAPVPPEAQRQ
jgi:hypothetical protein